MRRVNGMTTCDTTPHGIMTSNRNMWQMPQDENMCGLDKIKWGWIRTDERLMSGLSVIDDTCHQKTKQKGDIWEPCVTPLKKDQVVDKNG